jgi:hypothetical protein
MQSDAKRSRGRIPAICDLQGDFQELQGEPVLLPVHFLIVSIGWKEFSRPSEQGAFFGIAAKKQGAFSNMQGGAAYNCEWWQGFWCARASRAERPAWIRRDHARFGILQSADRHRRGRAWVALALKPEASRTRSFRRHRPLPLLAGEYKVEMWS